MRPQTINTMQEEPYESDISKLKEAIALFESKICAQGLVVNARDAEHLARLKAILKDLIYNQQNQQRQ